MELLTTGIGRPLHIAMCLTTPMGWVADMEASIDEVKSQNGVKQFFNATPLPGEVVCLESGRMDGPKVVKSLKPLPGAQ